MPKCERNKGLLIRYLFMNKPPQRKIISRYEICKYSQVTYWVWDFGDGNPKDVIVFFEGLFSVANLEKCPNTELFLLCIFLYSGQNNRNNCVWTLFTQYIIYLSIIRRFKWEFIEITLAFLALLICDENMRSYTRWPVAKPLSICHWEYINTKWKLVFLA